MCALQKPDPSWYKHSFTLAIKNAPWVEKTKNEVDFIVDIIELSGSERVLDLACGFGRHSIELSKRGLALLPIEWVKWVTE